MRSERKWKQWESKQVKIKGEAQSWTVGWLHWHHHHNNDNNNNKSFGIWFAADAKAIFVVVFFLTDNPFLCAFSFKLTHTIHYYQKKKKLILFIII